MSNPAGTVLFNGMLLNDLIHETQGKLIALDARGGKKLYETHFGENSVVIDFVLSKDGSTIFCLVSFDSRAAVFAISSSTG